METRLEHNVFFCLKHRSTEAKSLGSLRAADARAQPYRSHPPRSAYQSLLVLFFRKEPLSSLPLWKQTAGFLGALDFFHADGHGGRAVRYLVAFGAVHDGLEGSFQDAV